MTLTNDRRRFTVELSDRLDKELDDLAADLGKKKSDLLRLAIEYLLAANEAKSDGYKVGAWMKDADGEIKSTREFVGLKS
jgi:predicted transcriptional regulator